MFKLECTLVQYRLNTRIFSSIGSFYRENNKKASATFSEHPVQYLTNIPKDAQHSSRVYGPFDHVCIRNDVPHVTTFFGLSFPAEKNPFKPNIHSVLYEDLRSYICTYFSTLNKVKQEHCIILLKFGIFLWGRQS